jgi:hypothetical protein
MLKRRGCNLDFVELVSDPNFSICKDYIAKGLDLILDTEKRPQLLASMVKKDGFATESDAAHNMVQPALTVEDAAGNLVSKWNWHDLTGEQKWGGDTNSPTVFLRQTADSVLDAVKKGSFDRLIVATYPSKWPREAFPFINQLPTKARL